MQINNNGSQMFDDRHLSRVPSQNNNNTNTKHIIPTIINIPCVRILIPTTTINGIIQYQPTHIPLSSLNQLSNFSTLSNISLPTLQALATLSTLANLKQPSSPILPPNKCITEVVITTEDIKQPIANLNPKAKVFAPGASLSPSTTSTFGENTSSLPPVFTKLETIDEDSELNSNEGSGEEIGESYVHIDDEDSKRSELQNNTSVVDGETDEIEIDSQIMKELLIILNTINAYNYQLLSRKVKHMINDKNRTLILYKIMEIAIHENSTIYGMQYAKLCKFFNNSLILTNCKSLFNVICNMSEIEDIYFTGVLRWFACLYVVGVINKCIIHDGILVPLLMKYKSGGGIPSGRDIEGVCELLKIIGKKMQKRSTFSMDEYLNYLETLQNSYDFRTKIIIQNLVKMRDENWIRIKNNGKVEKGFKKFEKNDKFEKNEKFEKFDKNENISKFEKNKNYTKNRNTAHFNNFNNHGYYYYDMNTYDSKSRYKTHHTRNNYQRYRNNNRSNGRNNRRSNGRRSMISQKISAEFVCDVSLPDRGEHARNSVLVKTWRMKNSGNIEWGSNVELVFFKGQEEMITAHRISIGNCMPGEEIDLSINVCTPAKPGRYCAYYRLQKSGKFFGPRVWVDLISVIPDDDDQTFPC